MQVMIAQHALAERTVAGLRTMYIEMDGTTIQVVSLSQLCCTQLACRQLTACTQNAHINTVRTVLLDGHCT